MILLDNGKDLLQLIVDRVNVGVFVVDTEYRLTFWNNFMAVHSTQSVENVLGQNLFEVFPELPKAWFKKKIDSVFLLKSYAFTSWEQRNFIFKFKHSRPATGGVDYMYQSLTLIPVSDDGGAVTQVLIIVRDATDEAFYAAKLKEAMAELEQMSQVDGLTGLYNRRFWEKSLNIEFNRSKRYDLGFCLLMVDIDHFKKINDEYGHLIGDEAIRLLAEILLDSIRDSDIVGRYGGEEFGLILVETPVSAAYTVAERIRKRVMDTPLQVGEVGHQMTVSIGLCAFDPNMERHEQAIAAADEALYESKNTGRNRVTVSEKDRPFLIKQLAQDSGSEPLDPPTAPPES